MIVISLALTNENTFSTTVVGVFPAYIIKMTVSNYFKVNISQESCRSCFMEQLCVFKENDEFKFWTIVARVPPPVPITKRSILPHYSPAYIGVKTLNDISNKA